MALSDHLRELRARVLKIAVVITVGLVVSLFFFDQIFALVLEPYAAAQAALGEDVRTEATIAGAGGPLMLYLKLCGLVSVVLTSPFWLYQIWAFILPGLHDKERKWSRVFAAIAGPLFLAGVVLGYLTLPKGLEILIGLTPGDLTNLVEFGDYLTFLIRTLLVFGIAFEIPVFVILLNLAGVLPGAALGAHRAWIVIGTFVFAAIATPSTDPFTMLFLAVPMVVLFAISEVIARFLDKRRAQADPAAGLADDELSPI
ncbi:twin-arginine translocase subunit TatC [Nocardioides euryhalodurans]|uniref:Sec-independent protein translocase protein TatC n=1 Tax=Nocardioides euryhalodurans TaxID=2518370 RepID=A0A4V1BDH8_9ACTN|nr:twin-arginine translocase subunit TatC [Nocardioides euryhalodurans]QBR91172.1 twin-arginine translocase subunit TatC [Nocardioides euryhalodurans]